MGIIKALLQPLCGISMGLAVLHSTTEHSPDALAGRYNYWLIN